MNMLLKASALRKCEPLLVDTLTDARRVQDSPDAHPSLVFYRLNTEFVRHGEPTEDLKERIEQFRFSRQTLSYAGEQLATFSIRKRLETITFVSRVSGVLRESPLQTCVFI
jgi:hypothetical protein